MAEERASDLEAQLQQTKDKLEGRTKLLNVSIRCMCSDSSLISSPVEALLELEIVKAEKEVGVDVADATQSTQYKQLEMQNNRLKEVFLFCLGLTGALFYICVLA